MKKSLIKDSIIEIKKTYKRFLSIMLMSLLGVGFFAGIRATSPDMEKTIDNYYKDLNVYDIQMISTLGHTDKDIEILKSDDNIEEIVGTYSKDVLVKSKDNSEQVIKVISIEDINKIIVIDGKKELEENECLVEKSFLNSSGKKIGDSIKIEDDGSFKNNNLKIVGTVESPLYLSRDRGTSTLGTGKVGYYIYTSRDNFKLDVYTELYIKLRNSDRYMTGSDEYKKLVEKAQYSIELLKDEINNRRYNELVDTANDKIVEAENEIEKNKSENGKKLDDAQKEIDNYKNDIENALILIEQKRIDLNNMFLDYSNQIQSGKEQIENAKNTLENQKKFAQENINNISVTKSKLIENIAMLDVNIEIATQKRDEVFNTLENPKDLSESEIEYLKGLKIEIETEIENLNRNKNELNEQIYQIDLKVVQINQEIQNAENAIIDQQITLIQRENEIESYKSQAYSSLDTSLNEVNSNKITIEEKQIELDQSRVEFEDKIKEAEDELLEAREELLEIEHPKLYVLDREENAGYSGFIQDTQSVANIGKVFPIVFFVVATLISLTSMTRMVEEQRQQIGTLKALGYTKLQISFKYILYASLATIIGGIIGMCIGFIILPKIIWMMYSMMYYIPNFVVEFNFEFGMIGLICAYICIIGATIYACSKELIEKPAVLMRPNAPKSGKRVILERIPFIWKKLDFTSKVTIRNMFRYKKRFLMTIIGIFGCTSLIFVGFCLKDSISNIIDNQYGDVFNYDYITGMKNSLTENEINDFEEELKKRDDIELLSKTHLLSTNILANSNNQEVQIIVPYQNEELYDIVSLIDLNDNKVSLDNEGILLTDKAASLMNVKEGDTVTINVDDEEIQVTVSKIVKNYISHYAYMSKELYEELFGEYKTNALMIKHANLTQEQSDELSRFIMQNSKVSSHTDVNSMKSLVDNTMSCLNYVVWVLIVSSGLLAFVVLYNLANVNISERIRELATIKVLGFYDDEVYKYVSKETSILTFIGIILGIFGGIFLTTFILKTCEINILRFTINVKISSIIYSVLITILFTTIVNIVTYFTLKKVDMIESLKSVE